MYRGKKFAGLFKSGVSLLLVLALLLGGSLAPEIARAEQTADTSLEEFRRLFNSSAQAGVSSSLEFGSELETIYIDDSRIIHRPQEFIERELAAFTPYSAGHPDSGPYSVGYERSFIVFRTGGPAIIAKAKLVSQGEHSNVWLIDDADFHSKAGGTLCLPSTCGINRVTQAVTHDIAMAFDGIYKRMTDPLTGFAPHANQLINQSWGNQSFVGDFGNDGKVNILLSDIDADGGSSGGYIAGYHAGNDSFNYHSTNWPSHPIDVFHMDIGVNQGLNNLLEENGGSKLSFYGTLAHEFQHMLFYMYVATYFDTAAAHNAYVWYNEALSGLANVYYVQPGAEIITTSRFLDSTTNNYQAGDLFNWSGSSKQYSMGYLHSMMMYRKTNATYARKAFNTMISLSGSDFSSKYSYLNNVSNHDRFIGGALKSSLAPVYDTWDAVEVFKNMYSIFMEHFAADGGLVYSQSGVPSTTGKFQSRTNWEANLWQGRYHYLNQAPPWRIDNIASGGNVRLQGYGGMTGGASHEMIYFIGTNTDNPVLRIQIPNNDSTANMEYYVAVINPDTSALASGASVYHLNKGQNNDINTNGRGAFLFVTTLRRNVNVNVTYSWHPTSVLGNALTGTATINITAPRFGNTLTASLASGNSTSLTYTWFVDNVQKNTGTTYTVTADDIGKTIRLRITATDGKTGELWASTAPAARALHSGGSITAPTLSARTGSSITLATVAGYEYSLGGSLWQDSPIFTGLLLDVSYNFYQRVKATATVEASAASIVRSFTTSDATFLRGDVNGDGFVNQLDLAILMLQIAGQNNDPNTQLQAMDLNADGFINQLDLAILMLLIAGVS